MTVADPAGEGDGGEWRQRQGRRWAAIIGGKEEAVAAVEGLAGG